MFFWIFEMRPWIISRMFSLDWITDFLKAVVVDRFEVSVVGSTQVRMDSVDVGNGNVGQESGWSSRSWCAVNGVVVAIFMGNFRTSVVELTTEKLDWLKGSCWAENWDSSFLHRQTVFIQIYFWQNNHTKLCFAAFFLINVFSCCHRFIFCRSLIFTGDRSVYHLTTLKTQYTTITGKNIKSRKQQVIWEKIVLMCYF